MPIMLLRTFTILLVALLSGLAFTHVLELPAKMQYEAPMYITLQKSLYVQWGTPNIGGVLEPAAIIATTLMAFFGRKNKRSLWLALGALSALLAAFPVVFFMLVAPANAGFMGPTASVTVFDNTDFKLASTEMAKSPGLMRSWGITEKDIKEESELIFKPSAKIHDLSDFNFHQKIKSLKITCN